VVPSFDGFRGVAVLGVVLYHILFVTGALGAAGGSWMGVLIWGLFPHALDVLFIVSGFVLFLPAATTGTLGSVPAFFLRRFARIIPAYWTALGLAAGVAVLLGTSASVLQASTVLIHLGLAQSPALLIVDGLPLGFNVIAPVWTLSIDAIFYLVLPLVAAWYLRRPWAGLASAGALAVAWDLSARHSRAVVEWFGMPLSEAALHRIEIFSGSQFPHWAFALACGMTGAQVFVRLSATERPFTPWAGRTFFAGAICACALVSCVAGVEAVRDSSAGVFARESPFVVVGYPLALMALMLAIALVPGIVRRTLASRVMRWLGDASYGIYLIHFAIIWVALRVVPLPRPGPIGGVLIWTAVVVPLSVGYGYLSARFIERPIRQWARRSGRRLTGSPQAGASAA
jgi:peptidoglycan/LPS O-acetylase OafA/YrhL